MCYVMYIILLQLKGLQAKLGKVENVFTLNSLLEQRCPIPTCWHRCLVFSVRQQSPAHSEFPLHHTAIWQVQVLTYVGKYT